MTNTSAFPLIWYKFESPSSSKVQNFGSAGVLLDATLHNGASVINNDSPTGSTCLNLNNNPVKLSNDPSGQYLSIPRFTLGGAFSCSCWFKKANVEESWNDIFHFSLSENGVKSLSLCLVSNSGQIVLSRDDNNGKNIKTTNGTNYCDDKWHHVVVVSTGTSLVFYIDYQEISTTEYTVLENIDRVNNYIGRSSSADAYASIQVDDFRLYTTPINDDDVKALYTYKKTLPSKETVITQENRNQNTTNAVLITILLLFGILLFTVAILLLQKHRSVS